MTLLRSSWEQEIEVSIKINTGLRVVKELMQENKNNPSWDFKGENFIRKSVQTRIS